MTTKAQKLLESSQTDLSESDDVSRTLEKIVDAESTQDAVENIDKLMNAMKNAGGEQKQEVLIAVRKAFDQGNLSPKPDLEFSTKSRDEKFKILGKVGSRLEQYREAIRKFTVFD